MAKTALLHVALVILIVVVFFYGFISLADPTDDPRRWDVADFLLFLIPLPVLGISIVASIILLVLGRRAYCIPLLAGGVVIVSAIVGLVIAGQV